MIDRRGIGALSSLDGSEDPPILRQVFRHQIPSRESRYARHC